MLNNKTIKFACAPDSFYALTLNDAGFTISVHERYYPEGSVAICFQENEDNFLMMSYENSLPTITACKPLYNEFDIDDDVYWYNKELRAYAIRNAAEYQTERYRYLAIPVFDREIIREAQAKESVPVGVVVCCRPLERTTYDFLYFFEAATFIKNGRLVILINDKTQSINIE